MNINNKDLKNVANMIEDNYKTEKDSSYLLIKQKMWKTHDLIKQYSEKVKEINSLKLDLEITKKEAMRMMSNSKSAIDKVAELKNNMTNIEEENKKLKSKAEEYEINIAAYKQTIQQLTCKIEEMGEEHANKIMEYDIQKSGYEDKLKNLECDLKKCRLTLKQKEKRIASNTTTFSTKTKSTTDVGTNVSLCDSELNTIFQVRDKNIMTDEFYNTKDDPYPIFCAKCEAHLPPTITPEKICKTMSTYPELIDGNLFSPPKKVLPSCLSLDAYSDSTNKYENIFPFEVLSSSLLNPCNNQYSDPTGHLKSQLKHSFGTQNSENELKDSNIAMHVPVATNISTSPSYSAAKFTLPENIDHTKKFSYSDDLLARHSSSFKKIQKKVNSLESKMKELRRSLKKQRTSSCCHHCITNDNGAFLNSNLLSTICKSIVEYYDEKRENERQIESEKYSVKRIQLKKRKRSNEYNVSKNPFSSQCKNLEEDTSIQEGNTSMQGGDTSIQEENILIQEENTFAQDTIKENHSIEDTIYNESEEVTKKTDILQSSHILCINKSIPTLNVNVSNVFCNSTDQFCEEAFVVNREAVSVSAKKASLEDNERISHSSNDKVCTRNNLSSESNMESTNESVMETIGLLSDDNDKTCDEYSIDHAGKIHTIAEVSDMKRKNQNKKKLNNRLLKNIRNLKRKTQTSHLNKQEDIESEFNCSSEYNELARGNRKVENKNETDKTCAKRIRNLKRNLETPEISSTNDIELYSEPPKKLRIAHIPKTPSVPQLSINQQNFTHHTIKNIINFDASRQKYDRIQRLGTLTQKNSILIKDKKDCAMNKNYEKNFDEYTCNINQKSTSFTLPVTNNKYVPTISECNKNDDKDETNENLSDGETTSIICEEVDAQTKTIEPRKVITRAVELYSCNTIEDEHGDDCDTSKNVNNELTSNRLEAMCCKSHNRDMSDKTCKVRDLPSRNSATIVLDCVDDNNTHTEESLDKANERTKSTSALRVSINDVEEFQTPMCRLTKYINVKKRIVCKKQIKKTAYICKIADKFVKKQLEKLRDNPWEDSVHYDVIQKLKSTCGPRIIAKCIVEFLLENVNYMENLDKSFTPPAPLMTAFEQKIIALLVDLEASKPKIVHFVQAAIEYNLFKLTNKVKVQVETLTRMYVVLSRIQKDREKVRMMCCNALYCMGFKSISVLYTILTCWPEVLPNAETNKGILPKCIAFLISSQCASELNKLNALKSLISVFYKYSCTTEAIKNIVEELMNALKAKQVDGMETAIILIAKREGPSWAYENIIRSNLLPMIINRELPCVYSAFSLLGKLMRAFPLEDTDHVVQNISEQLRDLIQSGQGSDDQQEGIISALLSLSRHKFDVVAQCVINWTPNKSLRPATITQLEALINARNAKYWKQYLQQKCIQSKKNDTLII